MKTFSHLWQYLAKFSLEWEMFQTKVVEKIKIHILCSTNFLRKSHRLWDNVEKYVGVRGATDDVTIWRIRVACWLSKATFTYAHAHSHALGHTQARARAHICNIYIAFPRRQWIADAHQYYVMHTLPVLFACCLVLFMPWTRHIVQFVIVLSVITLS
jgi:hypothetical protein